MAHTFPVCRPDRGRFPLSELAARCAADFGPLVATRVWNGQRYDVLTFRELGERVTCLARWMISRGVTPGDRVAILDRNGPRWAIAYLATQAAGAVSVPIDPTLPGAGLRHILSHSGACVLLAGARFLDLLADAEPVPALRLRVALEGSCASADAAWDETLLRGGLSRTTLPQRRIEDLAAILYTSGTTGHSKGVMLSHRNIIANVAGTSRTAQVEPGETFLAVLPLHHAFGCTASFLLPLYIGCGITFARGLSSAALLADVQATRVSVIMGVPLLYEKMQAGLLRGIRRRAWTQRSLFRGLDLLSQTGERLGLSLGSTLFRQLRSRAGLASLRYLFSGGGALDPETSRFFHRLGIPLLQGFGLTETSPVTHLNPPGAIRHATVGLPLPEVEATILGANQEGIGELCVRGPSVFSGYYKNDEATREAIDADGWFHTGDLGKIDADGYLEVTGRMKNLIVTGGGKNVYPEEIEQLLNHSPYVAESLVLGVRRSSGFGEEVAALVHPDYEALDVHFEKLGQTPADADVLALIRQEIRRIQSGLPEHKRVRHLRLVEEEFQKTSTRKIKRFLYRGEMLDLGHPVPGRD